MTDEEIIKLARDAGFDYASDAWLRYTAPKFRAVICETIERAAKLCDAAASGDAGEYAADLAAQIRALKGGANVES